jgi:uncharacterized protein (TIGR02246 family)
MRLLLLPAFLLCATPAFAQDPAQGAETVSPIRDVVEAGNYLFQRAFEDADARALADLYTEDGQVIPPGMAPLSGRPAIAAFWAEQMKATQRVRLETKDVESDGNLAAEQGVARLIAHDGSETSIQYIVVWKRIGRRWHLHRDIWNAAPEPAIESPAEPGAPTDDDPVDGAMDEGPVEAPMDDDAVEAPMEAAPLGATGSEAAP